MMLEPITIAQAQRTIRKVLTRIERREEYEARDRRERVEDREFSRELDRWSFNGR